MGAPGACAGLSGEGVYVAPRAHTHLSPGARPPWGPRALGGWATGRGNRGWAVEGARKGQFAFSLGLLSTPVWVVVVRGGWSEGLLRSGDRAKPRAFKEGVVVGAVAKPV